jgi:hypothetical protein
MDKVKRYDWAMPGDVGEFRWIAVSELRVDVYDESTNQGYQRKECSKANTLNIAREFDWVIFGVLVCMQRADDSIWVVDGWQRLGSVRARGDIPKVPCIVFRSLGSEHEQRAREALSFARINSNRKTVQALDKFNALVTAKEEPYAEIAAWLRDTGFSIADHPTKSGGLSFVREVINNWKSDKDRCKASLKIQREFVLDEPLHVDIHKAVFYLLGSGVDVFQNCEKIRTLGGKERVRRAINTKAAELGRMKSQRVCALGLLEVINHGRRNKIRIDDQQLVIGAIA